MPKCPIKIERKFEFVLVPVIVGIAVSGLVFQL
jgi:hypothetical protein